MAYTFLSVLSPLTPTYRKSQTFYGNTGTFYKVTTTLPPPTIHLLHKTPKPLKDTLVHSRFSTHQNNTNIDTPTTRSTTSTNYEHEHTKLTTSHNS